MKTEYPGDYSGLPPVEYTPEADGDPDPGEIVWGWVPYQEDPARGKDRPVLIVGREGPWLLGLPVTSKDHARDHDQEAQEGRLWMDIGRGGWDPEGRPSEVRINRVVRLAPTAIRREGAALPPNRYGHVIAAMRHALSS